MRSASFVAAVAAFSSDLVTCQTPASGPTTTRITFSGNGCPQGPSARTGGFSDGVYTFNHFAASYPGTNSTVNCQAHINASGSSPGWQVALSTLDAKGHVVLDPGTTLNYYTTVFWSASASATVCIPSLHSRAVGTPSNIETTDHGQGFHFQRRGQHSRLPHHHPPDHPYLETPLVRLHRRRWSLRHPQRQLPARPDQRRRKPRLCRDLQREAELRMEEVLRVLRRVG